MNFLKNIPSGVEIAIGGVLGIIATLFTAHGTGKLTGEATNAEISGYLGDTGNVMVPCGNETEGE